MGTDLAAWAGAGGGCGGGHARGRGGRAGFPGLPTNPPPRSAPCSRGVREMRTSRSAAAPGQVVLGRLSAPGLPLCWSSPHPSPSLHSPASRLFPRLVTSDKSYLPYRVVMIKIE